MPTMQTTDERALVRDRIRAAALPLFARHGVDGTRLLDVARGASMSKGGVFHHFSTKELLLDDLMATFLGQIDAALESVPPAPPQLGRFVRTYLDLAGGDDDRAAFFLTIVQLAAMPGSEHPARAHLARHRASSMQLLQHILPRPEFASDVLAFVHGLVVGRALGVTLPAHVELADVLQLARVGVQAPLGSS